jgi:hypothetical protein
MKALVFTVLVTPLIVGALIHTVGALREGDVSNMEYQNCTRFLYPLNEQGQNQSVVGSELGNQTGNARRGI